MTNSEWHDAAQQQERGGELLLAAIRQAHDESCATKPVPAEPVDIGILATGFGRDHVLPLLNRAVEIFRESQT